MPQLTCPECGVTFTPVHHRALFCTPAHKSRFYDVQRKRGVTLAPLVAVWARSRRKPGELSAYAHRELCALEAAFAREDKAAGRDPRLTVQAKHALGWKAVDLA